MTPSEFAARLNGREYMEEITSPEEAEAKAAGLVVMFGASDDNVELRGAVRDELSAIDGTTVRMTPHGPLPAWESLDKDDDSEDDVEAYFVKKMAGFKEIEAEFAPKDEPSLSWRFKTEIPHATFEVMEDGEVFCRGIVFRLADVSGVQPTAPARMLTVDADNPATGKEYVAGLWSRRNWEAAMRDQIEARTMPQGEALQHTENPDHDFGAA